MNIRNGNKKDYSEAYVFYYKKLFNYGKKFTEEITMIEDSINEVFIMIWDSRQNLHTINSPQSYIFSSFRNSIFQKIKKTKLLEFREVEQETEVQFSIDTIIIKNETDAALKRQLEKALQQLTSRQREAIFLRFYEGLSYIEVAGVMNISVKATYKIMSRALSELKDILSVPMLLLLAMLEEFL
ncbi:MAG: sigma-70 family RNA polymerase sigma factor [Ginsengibacter sp.]